MLPKRICDETEITSNGDDWTPFIIATLPRSSMGGNDKNKYVDSYFVCVSCFTMSYLGLTAHHLVYTDFKKLLPTEAYQTLDSPCTETSQVA